MLVTVAIPIHTVAPDSAERCVVSVMNSVQTIDEKIECSKRPKSPGYRNVRTIYPNHRRRNRRICRSSLGRFTCPR